MNDNQIQALARTGVEEHYPDEEPKVYDFESLCDYGVSNAECARIYYWENGEWKLL